MSKLSNAEKIQYMLSLVKRYLLRFYMLLCRVWPIDRKKAVIMSYYGGGFGDNGKAVALELHRRMPDVTIVWPLKPGSKEKLPDFCKTVKYRSLAYYREMATAAVWVDNARKDAEIIKRKNQFYIQTWHGMVALKQIEKDAEDSLGAGYLAGAKNDSKMADLILSGCGFFTKLCRRAFWYDGEILECGSPRLDVLFHMTPEKRRFVREQLGIPEDKRILLYAPTFRVTGETECYIGNYEQILSALKEKTGDDWVAAVRLHPNIADKADFITYTDRVINATAYPDLYELIPLADIVVSDYSSLMFDAGLINKPVLRYATDIDAYVKDRKFYFDTEKLPFPLSREPGALIDHLLNFDEQTYRQELDVFNKSLDYYENGTASEAVVDRIMEVLRK